MARKPLTEEQKEALRTRLAAAREAKKNKTNTSPQTQTQQEQPQQHSAEDPNLADLTRMVLELKAELAKKNETPDLASQLAEALGGMGGSQVNKGKLVGTTERYSVNKSNYDDPREQLRKEARLQRIAFDANYELEWLQDVTSYETKDGVSMKEPKFTLKLNQVVLDDNGEPTNKRVGKAQMIFFEDPETAIVVANQNGIEVDEVNQQAFLNAMRYIRVRDWLFECFWPPRTDQTVSNKRTEVIGGQVVDTWEVSTEGNAKIPFDQLSSKLRA